MFSADNGTLFPKHVFAVLKVYFMKYIYYICFFIDFRCGFYAPFILNYINYKCTKYMDNAFEY